MSPIVATIFRVDRIIDSSLLGGLVQVLCARTGKSNFDVARFVLRCAVLFLFISAVLMLIYGLVSRRLEFIVLPPLTLLSMRRGFSYESQKLPVIETEVKDSLTGKDQLSPVLLKYWRADRVKRICFLGMALVILFPIARPSKPDLSDISLILLSMFWLTWSFYFYLLYHPLSVPLPTETEK